MAIHLEQLLTDQQLKEASPEQINDLVHRIDMTLQMRGEFGLVRRQHDELYEPTDPSFPLDPGTIGSE